MDINEIKKERTKLEDKIFFLIKEFEQETSTAVEYIRVDREQLIGYRLQQLAGISIKLEV